MSTSEPLDDDAALPADSERYNVPALERGLNILSCFGAGAEQLGAPDIARQLDLPRSTVFRLLATLENMGFLERSGNDYRLGMGVLRLGYDYLSTQSVARVAQPVLQRLCASLGFACNLALRDGAQIVYVARMTPPGGFVGAVRVGTRLPAHATVLGRALMQDMDRSALQRVFEGVTLQPFSSSTPQSVAQLEQVLQGDRERGYVLGESFYEMGVSSIAAPVRNADNAIVAGLGVAIPFQRIDDPSRIADWAQQVQAAVQQVSDLLSAQQPRPR